MPPPPRAAGWSAPTRPRARPGCRRSEIPPSNECFPPRTPIVSITGTPQAAMLLPSHTPPVGCQAIGWPRSAPACRTSPNNASSSGVIGLGGRAKPPWTGDRDLMLGGDRRDRVVDQRSARAPGRRASRGRRLTRSTARSGTTLLGPPPSILRRIDRQPVAHPRLEPQREVGRRDQRIAPVLGIAPGVRRPAASR